MRLANITLFISLLLASFFLASPVATAAQRTIKVGVIERPPFLVKKEDGTYSGLAFDIWNRVAESQNWTSKYVTLSSDLADDFAALKAGKVDVLVGGIPVNTQGLSAVDFSRPIFINRVGLVYHKTGRSFWKILGFLLMDRGNYFILGLVGLFLVFCHLLWLSESGEDYRKNIGQYIWQGYLSIGMRGGNPRTVTGKVLMGIWLLISIFVLSIIIASFTSALTISLSSKGRVLNVSDFRYKRAAYVMGSIDSDSLKQYDLTPMPVGNFSESVEALSQKRANVIVASLPTAEAYFLDNTEGDLEISSDILNYVEYAFAFRRGSSLEKKFNLAHEKLKQSEQLVAICRKYVSEQDALLCSL